MTASQTVFEKTYNNYLAQLNTLDLNAVGQKLGAKISQDEIIISVLGNPHQVSAKGITDSAGRQPSLDICVILCKYLLLCPTVEPRGKRWVAFRDFKDSGPLTTYFANDVERAIAVYFRGRLTDMVKASKSLGGFPPHIDVRYDLAMQFDALPQIPLLLLFNDADDEFPAKCSVLFESRAEVYLDAECLAMLGRLLFTSLKTAATLDPQM
ncbi:MAG: DUF3786 domain-containing protein [Desulfobacterales bacterium]|jgi:hypothetical protein